MKSEEDFRQILLTLISIFPQNMDEYFQPACLYLEIRRKKLNRV